MKMLCIILLLFHGFLFHHINEMVLDIFLRFHLTVLLLLYSLHPFYFQYSLKKHLQRFRSKLCKRTAQPFLFCNTLLTGHGAADMFLVNIFFCDTNIVHPFFLLIKTAVPAVSAFLLLEKWLQTVQIPPGLSHRQNTHRDLCKCRRHRPRILVSVL